MFWFLQEHGTEVAEQAGGHAEAAAEHTPAVVELVNQYLGPWANRFELEYTKPVWDRVFAKFGTTAEAVFGPYTVENAIPWYTVMFFLACIITLGIIWILKG